MRGKRAKKREILPDPKFKSITIAKFINQVMKKGKKTIAQKIVYGTFDLLKEKHKKDPLEIFSQAMKNVTPQIGIRAKRIGGANYQVPVEMPKERALTLAMRWIIGAARQRKGMPMKERLALELLDAFNNQGLAIKKRQDVYRMAQANRAFAYLSRR